jgi:uncharacterized membrane protein required for colicin V production
MTLILDGAVVGIIVLTCIIGYVLGFFKYAALLLKSVAAIVAAALVAFMFAEPLYCAVAQDKAVKVIEEKIDKVDVVNMMETDLRKKGLPMKVTNDDLRQALLKEGDVVKNMRDMISSKEVDGAVADKTMKDFEDYLDNELFGRILKAVNDSGKSGNTGLLNMGLENTREELAKFVRFLIPTDKHKAAQNIEEHYVRPFGKMIAGAGLFFVTAIIVSIVLMIVVRMLDILSRIKVLSAANSFGGLALGAAKGILYVVIGAYIVSTVVSSSKDQLDKLNTDIINKTYLFKYFFRLFY